jgi:hypothetical protein
VRVCLKMNSLNTAVVAELVLFVDMLLETLLAQQQARGLYSPLWAISTTRSVSPCEPDSLRHDASLTSASRLKAVVELSSARFLTSLNVR